MARSTTPTVIVGFGLALCCVFSLIATAGVRKYDNRPVLRGTSGEKESTGSPVVKFLRQIPKERRTAVFDAIKSVSKCMSKKADSAPSSSSKKKNHIINAGGSGSSSGSGSIIVLDQSNPAIRTATVVGVSALMYKSVEKVLNMSVVDFGNGQAHDFVACIRKVQHKIKNAVQSCLKSILKSRSPQADLPFFGDIEGSRLAGSDSGVVFEVADNATAMTTIQDLVGNNKAAIFAVDSATNPKDMEHIASIMRSVPALKAYGLDKVICIVKKDTFAVKDMKSREGVREHRLQLIADPQNRIETDSGLRLSSSRSCVLLEFGCVVTKIATPKRDQHSSERLVEYLKTRHLNSVPASPAPEREAVSV